MPPALTPSLQPDVLFINRNWTDCAFWHNLLGSLFGKHTENRTLGEETSRLAMRNMGWLANQPDWLKEELLACSRLRQFSRGQYAYHFEDGPGGMYGVANGSFGVLVPSGGEMIMCHVMGPGAWFGWGPILTGGQRSLSFRAVEESRALYVSLSDLGTIGARNPDLYRLLGALGEASMNAMTARAVGDLLIPSCERRIAAVLARLGSEATGKPPATLRLAQSVLGQMSNASRVRVNRALREFESAGWVSVRYQSIRVTDVASLEAFARREA